MGFQNKKKLEWVEILNGVWLKLSKHSNIYMTTQAICGFLKSIYIFNMYEDKIVLELDPWVGTYRYLDSDLHVPDPICIGPIQIWISQTQKKALSMPASFEITDFEYSDNQMQR